MKVKAYCSLADLASAFERRVEMYKQCLSVGNDGTYFMISGVLQDDLLAAGFSRFLVAAF